VVAALQVDIAKMKVSPDAVHFYQAQDDYAALALDWRARGNDV
jgi:hypothetical protein